MAKKFESVEEFNTKPTFDEDGVQVSSAIGKDGKEYPDPVPLEPPIGYNAPPDLMTMIRTMIRQEKFNQTLADHDYETFDEADDFDIDDDPLDALTPYEKVFEPPRAASVAPQDAASPPPPAPVPAPIKDTGPSPGEVASPPPAPSQSSTST